MDEVTQRIRALEGTEIGKEKEDAADVEKAMAPYQNSSHVYHAEAMQEAQAVKEREARLKDEQKEKKEALREQQERFLVEDKDNVKQAVAHAQNTTAVSMQNDDEEVHAVHKRIDAANTRIRELEKDLRHANAGWHRLNATDEAELLNLRARARELMPQAHLLKETYELRSRAAEERAAAAMAHRKHDLDMIKAEIVNAERVLGGAHMAATDALNKNLDGTPAELDAKLTPVTPQPDTKPPVGLFATAAPIAANAAKADLLKAGLNDLFLGQEQKKTARDEKIEGDKLMRRGQRSGDEALLHEGLKLRRKAALQKREGEKMKEKGMKLEKETKT